MSMSIGRHKSQERLVGLIITRTINAVALWFGIGFRTQVVVQFGGQKPFDGDDGTLEPQAA